MKASAILVAAGSGIRLGAGSPKAFVPLAGEPMLRYSLRTIATIDSICEAVITVPAGMESGVRAEVRAASLDIPVKITTGGVERQDSVRVALRLTSAESDLIVIHDAARPFARASLFSRCVEAAAKTGGAIAAIPVSDTLKRVDGRVVVATVPRSGLWQAQTPQAFRRAILFAAHERAERGPIRATDDAELVEQIGGKVEIVEGSELNLKITTPDDLYVAEALAMRLGLH
jgi:2-C-methyl-D-erythritol 4-phosphate cytidylyltransferase